MNVLGWFVRWDFYIVSLVLGAWGALFELDAIAKPLYLIASAMFYGLHEYRRQKS